MDIIDRLNDNTLADLDVLWQLRMIAADEIERLRAERDALRDENTALSKECGRWVFKNNALLAERDALRADALRYRWLRARTCPIDIWANDIILAVEELDDAIDAAMKETK